MKNKKCFFLLAVPIIIGLLSAIVMLLWNATLPHLLGVNPISYWQSMGLLILSKILFGGFGCGGKNKSGFSGSSRIRKKWRHMNEEERQKFKEEWKNRCKWQS